MCSNILQWLKFSRSKWANVTDIIQDDVIGTGSLVPEKYHYNDVIMGTMESQITSFKIIC